MRKLAYLLLSICISAGIATAQSGRTVTGVVSDDNGKPVADASVVVKGTQLGTTTDAKGSFTIHSVPASAKTLEISSYGYETRTVSIGTGTVSVTLKSSADEELGEVVVSVPYGIVKKKAFTGSETTVGATSIKKQQVTSVTKVLEGLVPGLQATNGGGAPGAGASILIRGIGSYSGSSAPLYVVNGVPYDGSISSISTDDIETVTILKDASAAALYGSRAANGVIMITTKSGKKGKAKVSVTVRQGFMSRGIPEYDRLDQKQYYEMTWEAIKNAQMYGANAADPVTAGQTASQQLIGGGLIYNAYNVANNVLVDPVTGKLNSAASLRWTDSWEKELFKVAPRTNVNVNVSGGDGKSDYFLSLGYLNEDGTVKYTNYKRYNLRMNVNTQATEWLKAGIEIDGAMSSRSDAIGQGGGTAGSSAFFFSRSVAPIYPVYEYDPITGAPVMDPITGKQRFDWGGNGSNMGTRPYLGNVNPLGALVLDDRSNSVFNGNGNTYLEIKFLKDFKLRTSFGMNIWSARSTTYQNNQFGDASVNGGRSTKSFETQISYTINEVLSWAKSYGNHNVSALAGHENYKYKDNYVSANKQGFQFPGQTELNNGSDIFGQPSSGEDHHRMESYFANVQYNYDQKYLFSASFRTDGSSRFRKAIRWGKFYSVGAGWMISQEDFLKNVNWINELKFKVSYGEQGNENIGLFYPYRLYYYANGVGGYTPPSRPAATDLKWEGNRTFNIGFDFAFFKRRLQGTVEYFNRVSNDLLFDVPQPISTGYLSAFQNIGTLKNTGIEIQLGYNIIRKKNFDWRADLNLTHYKNKFTKLPPGQRENGIVSGTKKLMEGRSMYDFWLVEFAGVNAATGEAMFYKDVLGTDGKPTGQRVLTNSYSEAANSRGYHGSAIPDFYGGLTNSFRYKNFDLSFLFTFSYGSKFYDGNYSNLMHIGEFGQAWSTDILNRWQKPGDITNVPRVQNGVQATQAGTSTRFLMDGSYLNFKNITLSYTLPKNVTDKLKISGVQIFGNVDNVVLFSAKKGMNPQLNFSGVNDATYPPFRTVTFGINVNL
ncbi:MAG: TonB-dependent receptor [Chitinophagaceae bacterium]|nr:TonB-dependent receptor [Chitinophagaceae bacterium]MCW5904369.1 TonB-dependent receptor [Chitinophagaceae bacterium]